MSNILLVNQQAVPSYAKAIEMEGHACFSAKDQQEAEKCLQNRPFGVLICEIRNQAEDFKLFDLARQLQPDCRAIAVIPESLEEYFTELLPRAYPHNFIADNRSIDVKELVITIRKLLSGDIFGIEKYEIPVSATLQLSSSKDKYPFIEKAREFYLGHGVSERIVRNVELILNELLMNALFDAPVAKDGSHPYVNLDRSEIFPLEEKYRPTLSYGISETHLAVSVSDPFGNLDKKTFFSYIHRCFSEKSVLEGAGKGAGMGLFFIFKSLDQMVINVAERRETEVIALIDHRGSLGELKRRRHSFHFFQIDGVPEGKENSQP